MRLLFFVLFIIYCYTISGQDFYNFSRFRPDSNKWEAGLHLVDLNDEHLGAVFVTNDFLGGPKRLVFQKINEESFLLVNEFELSVYNGITLQNTDASILSLAGNKMIVPVSITDTTFQADAGICFIDIESWTLDTLIVLDKPNFNVLDKTRIAPDGNYLHIGRNYVTEDNGDIWLVKMAPSGDVLWKNITAPITLTLVFPHHG